MDPEQNQVLTKWSSQSELGEFDAWIRLDGHLEGLETRN